MTFKDMALLADYAALDSAAVSDALDALGLPSGQAGFLPVWGHPKIVGFAVTVQLEPYAPGPWGAHIGATGVAGASSTDIIVVANDGRTDVSCWGGLLSLGAMLKGVRGVVADGSCRDVNEARELEFPVFAKGTIPATARGRLQQRSTGEPVRLGNVTVTPGDLIFADETGVVAVPRVNAEDILEKAQAITGREQAIASDLRSGVPLHEAMRDARLTGVTEEHR
jgi:regulator of RNase E activity RraA